MKTRHLPIAGLVVMAAVFLSWPPPDSGKENPRPAAETRPRPAAVAALFPATTRAAPQHETGTATFAIRDEDFLGKQSPFWQAPGIGRVSVIFPGGSPEVAIVERTEWRGVDRFVSRGRLEGHEGSIVLFAYSHGTVSGHVHAPLLGEFQINGDTQAGSATVANTVAPRCLGALPVPARNASAATALEIAGGAASPAPTLAATMQHPLNIDVLGLYLDTSFGPGTTEAMAQSNFDLNLELCNTSFARSGIPLRLRLVKIARTNYTETLTNDDIKRLGDAVEAVRMKGDGWMDEIHALRDQVGADLVFLTLSRFAPGAGGPSGRAYVQAVPNVRNSWEAETNPEFGFCVVKPRSDNNLSALVHEFGHNFGCAHDRLNAGSRGGAFPYSHGYIFTARYGERYRTIMAYSTQGERSALYFSNPHLTPVEFGVPVGVPEGSPGEADNAQTIARTMFEIAAFRLPADSAAGTRLINVSTLAWAGTGEEALVGGFVVTGDAPLPIVIRALGPSLVDFGVAATMPDPVFEVRRQSDGALVLRNDNWGDGGGATLVATGLAPRHSREPGAALTLAPGAYGVVVGAADGEAGNAIVEVYALGRERARLGNLSTRAMIADGRGMTAGFVVDARPGESRRIAVRALGPTLRDYGVASPLDDPVIELHDRTGALLFVLDDFSVMSLDTLRDIPGVRSYAQENIFAAGLQPGNRREPCGLFDLPAGAYSVVVRPARETGRGVALIEVFEVRPPAGLR